jgi:hypothetical protein
MLTATVSTRGVPTRTRGVAGLGNRNYRCVTEIRRKHQHQSRNDPEGEKRIERRQDATQVARRPVRKLPRNRTGGETAKRRDRPRPGRNLQPRAALRTHDIVRARRRFRRGNFRFAMWTHANSHRSPPNANAYNNRISAPMKRGDKSPERFASASGESPCSRSATVNENE